jgi:tetratricopeptide (TPR) repeat protein
MVNALIDLGNYTQAITYLDKALAIDPHDVDALNNKGGTLMDLGNYTEAIPYLERALAIDPNYKWALDNKGLTLADLENYTGAITYYDKALAIDPKYENALYNKGYDLAALGNYTEAISYYDKALAINPNDTYALDNKGLALDNLGNHTGAIIYYDKALAINPNDTYALDNKGVALDNLGNHTGAEQAVATPYDSGYSHGCSDAKISNLSERYINQPGNGPSSHTFSFMQGYYNGYSACSASSPPAQQPYNATERQQNPQIVQLNNGSIIVNGTVHTETDCSRTDLTQQERYTCGYIHGYEDAQTDWNSHRMWRG